MSWFLFFLLVRHFILSLCRHAHCSALGMMTMGWMGLSSAPKSGSLTIQAAFRSKTKTCHSCSQAPRLSTQITGWGACSAEPTLTNSGEVPLAYQPGLSVASVYDGVEWTGVVPMGNSPLPDTSHLQGWCDFCLHTPPLPVFPPALTWVTRGLAICGWAGWTCCWGCGEGCCWGCGWACPTIALRRGCWLAGGL